MIVNNAYYKNSNSFSEKLYNLTDNNYARYSTYKNSSFENVIDSAYQSKMLYIAELVLTGQFSVPKEMRLQASKSIVERYGTVWTTTSVSYASGIDVYFGYSGTLSNQDVFGNTLATTNPSYYRSLAASLANNNYTNYNTSNICQHEKVSANGSSNNNYNNSNNSKNENIGYKIELCSDPNVLRVILYN